jgi:hypothetical protein
MTDYAIRLTENVKSLTADVIGKNGPPTNTLLDLTGELV